MRRRALCSAIVLSAVATTAVAQEPAYLNHRAVILAVETANAADVDVALYVRSPSEPDWRSATFDRLHAHAIRYVAPRDGRYDFFLVLTNHAGQSSPQPEAASRAHAEIVVDTLPPLLQVHGVSRQSAATAQAEQLRIDLTFIEDNAGSQAVRVFYRAADEKTWRDGGALAVNRASGIWRIPADARGQIELNIIATDRAGNRTSQEVVGVDTGRIIANSKNSAATPRAVERQTSPPAAEPAPIAEKTLMPQQNPQTIPIAETNPPDDAALRFASLRAKAKAFVERGEYDLALARVGDALKLQPDDRECRNLAGAAHFWSGRYAKAAEHYRDVLNRDADNVTALEGLALVASTTRDYRTARKLLTRLTELQPEQGQHWLRLGDVSSRLADEAAAVRAWRKAAATPNADEKLRRQVRRRLDVFATPRDEKVLVGRE